MAQAKRINVNFALMDAVTPQVSARVVTPDEVRRMINAYNVWLGICHEPQDADANANGIWVLWKKQDATAADPTFSLGNINAESFSHMIIACGCWMASNQTPSEISIPLGKVSRNLQVNESLVLTSNLFGVSGGQVRSTLMICYSQTGN